jgi:hypothetical protein
MLVQQPQYQLNVVRVLTLSAQKRILPRFFANSTTLPAYLLYTKRDAVSAAKARSLVTKAEKLYLAQWRDIWSSFPQVVKTCVGAACVSVDKADDIAALQSRSRSFVSLARQAAALLKKVSRSRQSRLANEWLKSVLQINDKSRLKSSELPRFKSEC